MNKPTITTKPITYTCRGPVRGACGHIHRTPSGASACLRRDSRGCRAHGGYTDRLIFASDGDILRHDVDGVLVSANNDGLPV